MGKRTPFMAREMMEQPGVAAKIIKKRLSRDQPLFPELKKLDFGRIGRISFWGIGSSYHAALLASYQMEDLAGIPCECEQADEALARQAVVEPGTLVVLVSQSGRTGATVKAARYAKKQGALIVAVVNERGSALSKIANAAIDISAGRERAVPATKTFFATGLSLLLLALFLARQKGRPVKRHISALAVLPKLTAKLLKADYLLSVFAEHIALAGRAVVLGQGFMYPIALEGSLKLKETALVEASAYASEEYRHGPEALVMAGLPVVLLASDFGHRGVARYAPGGIARNAATTDGADLKLGKELLDRGADLLTIGRVKGLETKAAAFRLSAVPDAVKPLLAILPLQQLALAAGLAKGLDVDRPKGLKKFLK